MIQFQYWIDVIDRQSFRGSKAIEAAGRFSLAHSPADSSNPERRIRNVVVICIERNGSTCVIGESDFSVVQFFLLFVLFLFLIQFHFISLSTKRFHPRAHHRPHHTAFVIFFLRFVSFFLFFCFFLRFAIFGPIEAPATGLRGLTRFYQVLPDFTGFY